VLNLSGKKEQMLAAWQAYSRLYYDDRVKATAEREWEEVKKTEESRGDQGKALPKEAPLGFRNNVTQRIFTTESQEIKDEVDKYRKDLAAKNGAAEDIEDEDEKTRIEKAQAYHK
jgi:hypothetical protein